jgi:virginiamycin B lyase
LGRKLGGITVHAGARVMSEARPGEVLVSSMTKELVPASGFEFEDRGLHRLKGIDSEWHLYGVTAVDGAPRPAPLQPEDALRLREGIKPPPLVERRSGRIGVAALAILVAIGAALLIVHRPHPVQIRSNSLIRIDPKTNEIVADVPVADPGGSQLIAVPPHEIWVLSQQDQVISVVDATTNEVHSVGVFGGSATSGTAGYGLTYAAGAIWVTGGNNEVEELDPATRTVRATIRIQGGPSLLAAGYGRVWVTVHDRDLVVAIDPGSARVALKATIGSGANGIGVGEGAVWVSNYSDGTVSKIDPTSGTTTQIDLSVIRTVSGSQLNLAGGPATVGIGFGSAWVSDVKNGVVYRIDPATDQVVATIPVGRPSSEYASDIAAADGSMWVASPESKTIVRINPATNSVSGRIHVPYTPNGLTVGDGSVWVTLNP